MASHITERRAAIIGGGPAGLIAAETLAKAGISVDLFDQMPSLGRKLLMAGRGGLNLTHTEPLHVFLTRYGDAPTVLKDAVRTFPPADLRAWAHGLGEDTFAGTSGRVFPKSMKASPLLRAWLRRLDGLGVAVHLRHRFIGWNPAGEARFATPQGVVEHGSAATLLALGGASWPRLGSDGGWAEPLSFAGVPLKPFQPSNAGVVVRWSDHLTARHAGTPLKRLRLTIEGHEARGEAVITASGLEGGVIYALSRPIRSALDRDGHADLTLDLRPDFRAEWIADRLARTNPKESFASRLRKAAGLQPNAVALVQEAAIVSGQPLPKGDPLAIARRVGALPLRVTGLAGLDRAISTAGGVDFAGVSSDFMLSGLPGVFVGGEMLDWEAPTGGYLLQACFSSGIAAAHGMIRFLNTRDQRLRPTRFPP